MTGGQRVGRRTEKESVCLIHGRVMDKYPPRVTYRTRERNKCKDVFIVEESLQEFGRLE